MKAIWICCLPMMNVINVAVPNERTSKNTVNFCPLKFEVAKP